MSTPFDLLASRQLVMALMAPHCSRSGFSGATERPSFAVFQLLQETIEFLPAGCVEYDGFAFAQVIVVRQRDPQPQVPVFVSSAARHKRVSAQKMKGHALVKRALSLPGPVF